MSGQTDSQVSSQVHASRKNIIEGELSSILLANISLMDVTRLKLTWLDGQTARNVLRLACKFDLDQSERKSSQVHASTRKPWPNELASIPKFSTCVYLRLRLTRALPNIPQVISSNLNILRSSQWCLEAISSPPRISYRRCKNLRDKLLRAKHRRQVPPPPAS